MGDSSDALKPSPWLDRRVIAYAHQGGAWEAPSSTLFAIGAAIEAGAKHVRPLSAIAGTLMRIPIGVPAT